MDNICAGTAPKHHCGHTPFIPRTRERTAVKNTLLETPPPLTQQEQRTERRGIIALAALYIVIAAVNATLLYMAASEAVSAL